MSNTENKDTKLQNLLAAVTDVLMKGQSNVDDIVKQYNVPREDLDGFLTLIRRLHVTLVGKQPSNKFVQRLKHDLLESDNKLMSRLRYLPARVQIAAGVALVAGFMLISRRRLIDDAGDIPVLQQ